MNELTIFPSKNLAHDINRYTIAVVDSKAWLMNAEFEAGVFFGVDPDDPEYPDRLRQMRARIAKYEGVLDRLLQQGSEEEATTLAAPAAPAPSMPAVATEAVVAPASPIVEPARKSRRVAQTLMTDADVAAEMIIEALTAGNHPGAPLPILKIVEAKLLRVIQDFPDGAEAEVILFDGQTARCECVKIGGDGDAWRVGWSRMEGGDIELVDGKWRRAEPAKRASDLDSSIAELDAQIVAEPAPEPDTAPAVRPASLGQLLIDAGIAPNTYLLDLNGLPDYSSELPNPSRAYRSQIRYVSAERSPDGIDHVVLLEPVYWETTQMRKVLDLLGDFVDRKPRDADCLSLWHHAVDLMTEEHWRHLLSTRHMTTNKHVENAVAFALSTPAGHDKPFQKKMGRITLKTARIVLAALALPEPEDRSRSVILCPKSMSIAEASCGKCINTTGPGIAWGFVHGFEDGWLTRNRGGYVSPTQKLIEAQAERVAA